MSDGCGRNGFSNSLNDESNENLIKNHNNILSSLPLLPPLVPILCLLVFRFANVQLSFTIYERSSILAPLVMIEG